MVPFEEMECLFLFVCCLLFLHVEAREEFAGISSLLLPYGVSGIKLRPLDVTANNVIH